MPSIATGANAANKDLYYIGVSGDGDSLSIVLGQMCHAVRRNLNMLYILENNGVYGLTKGQFSAAADIGSKSKKGAANVQPPIDPARLALSLGATFVARAFSGDKSRLVPILKAGLMHKGFALVDVISPCVTFNDHEGSTKSYVHTRKHQLPVVESDYVPHASEITAELPPDTVTEVKMHDGSAVRFRTLREDYDASDRAEVIRYLEAHQYAGEIPVGLLHVSQDGIEMHDSAKTVDTPLNELPFEELCPGAAALDDLQDDYR
jgi:2-oxoglutarate ferredoxin oxidoreductase subunit beta